MRRLILISFLAVFVPGLAKAAGFEDQWNASSCRANIESFASGGTYTVERLRVKVGSQASTGVVAEIGSPNDYKSSRDSNWSTIVPATTGDVAQTTMSVIKGAWIAFKRQGPESVWSEIVLDESDHCRPLEQVSNGRATLPYPVRTYFEAADRQEAARAAPEVATAALPSACNGYIDGSMDTYAVSMRTVDTKGEPFFLAGISSRQTPLDRMDLGQRILWSAMVKSSGGWAVYYRRPAVGDTNYQVKYLTTDGKACSSYPNAPIDVSTSEMPEDALRHFLRKVGKSTDGTVEEMVARLGGALNVSTPNVAAPVGPAPAPPPPPAPQAYEEPPILSGDDLTRYVKALPKSAIRVLAGMQKICRDQGDRDASIDEEFVTRVDLDGDGTLDYVLNGDHAFCLNGSNGHTMIAGNGFTMISFIMVTTRGPSASIDIPAQLGVVYQYDGFAVVESEMNFGGKKYMLMRNGKEQTVAGLPRGGRAVYEISR